MKSKFNRMISIVATCACVASLAGGAGVAHATEIDDLENQSDSLSQELSDTNNEIDDLAAKIADAEVKIENLDNKIIKTKEQLKIAANSEADQYESMKTRIKYMYENGGESLVVMILEAQSMSDFLNKVDFVSNISSYDREQLNTLVELKENIQEQKESLQSDKKEQKALVEKLSNQQDTLKDKAKETKTDIASLEAEIAELKLQAMQAKEEAARKAAAKAAAAKQAKVDAAKAAQEEQDAEDSQESESDTSDTSNKADTSKTDTDSSDSDDSGSDYPYSTNDGALTPSKGVVYYNGHRETWYSQQILPGGGLNIPGRYVDSNGVVRDGDGYICVASSDYAKGTIVQTSLGTGKVYDCGCASGTIDIYTNW